MPEQSPLNWADRPDQVPMRMTLKYENRQKAISLTLGNCAVALFRHRPEMDYLAVHHQHEDEMVWTYIFDKHALLYWMADFALHREGGRALQLANRTHGTFYDRYGWNPDIVIESWPNEYEVDTYIEARMQRDLHQDLRDALAEDFQNE